jgi:glycosyltransferase involved in cell wall biosynthesis
MTRTVLHVLPHPGGGAEAYVALLDELEGYEHRRVTLATSRSRAKGAAEVPARMPALARTARTADILHIHGDTAGMLTVPLAGGRPSVLTTHGLHRLRRGGRLGGPLARRGVRLAVGAATATICTSASERGELEAIVPGELASRLVVVPNGAPVPPPVTAERREAARSRLGLDADRLVGLFAGRLEPRKEPLLAIEAVTRARAAGAPALLLVAGEGPLDEAVHRAAGPAVRPLGFYRDIEQLYAAADFFILPSRREGMSIAVLEAMAHGLPVLVAMAPASIETVGEAGLVVEPDPEALAEGIRRLAAPELREALARAGRERIERDLSAARFRERTAAVYDRVLGPAGPQGA